MTKPLATVLANIARAAPFERGRWRIGAAAMRALEAGGLPAERRTVATRHGFSMDLALDELVERTIFCTGEWEPLETQLLQRVLRPGDGFADVGANVGYFSLLAARLVGPQGRVHAFEANRRTFDRLEANLARNVADNVTAHLVAVGEAAGMATIAHHEDGNSGADSAVLGGEGPDAVPVARLDAVLAGVPLRLIKLDIEGWEAKALRGAEGLLARPDAPDLVFEFTPEFLIQAGDDPRRLIAWLQGLGYTLREMTNAGELEPGEHIYTRRQTYLYCTRRG